MHCRGLVDRQPVWTLISNGSARRSPVLPWARQGASPLPGADANDTAVDAAGPQWAKDALFMHWLSIAGGTNAIQ